MMATCNICKDDNKENPFSVPWDEFGKVFMEEHFKKDHPDISLYK